MNIFLSLKKKFDIQSYKYLFRYARNKKSILRTKIRR